MEWWGALLPPNTPRWAVPGLTRFPKKPQWLPKWAPGLREWRLGWAQRGGLDFIPKILGFQGWGSPRRLRCAPWGRGH